MRKITSIIMVLLMGSFLASAQSSSGIDYKKEGAPMPPIKAVTAKMKVYTERSFSDHNNFFVMLFNPTCSHCKELTKEIVKNRAAFKKHKLLLLATPPTQPYLTDFEKETGIYKYPEFVVAIDSANFIDRTYQYNAVPQVNVYDKNRKLIKFFTGDVHFKDLKAYLE